MDNEQKPPLIDLIERMNERIKRLYSECRHLSGNPFEFDREIREIQGNAQIDHSRSYPVWLCRKCGELFADEGSLPGQVAKAERERVMLADKIAASEDRIRAEQAEVASAKEVAGKY